MGSEKTLNILITGASRGIGLEMVKQYASGDASRIHACCRDPRRAQDLQRIASGTGDRVVIHALDVTDSDRIDALAKELSGEAIDLLMNNAGVYGGRSDGLEPVDGARWIDVLRVNTIAPIKMASAFLGHVEASRRKIIAAVSSKMGSIDDNSSGGYYAYRSSKAALNMAMRNLAIELRGRGIICVSLNPGWVRTDMGGASAPLSVEESVKRLRRVLHAVTAADSGMFLDNDGSHIPW